MFNGLPTILTIASPGAIPVTADFAILSAAGAYAVAQIPALHVLEVRNDSAGIVSLAVTGLPAIKLVPGDGQQFRGNGDSTANIAGALLGIAPSLGDLSPLTPTDATLLLARNGAADGTVTVGGIFATAGAVGTAATAPPSPGIVFPAMNGQTFTVAQIAAGVAAINGAGTGAAASPFIFQRAAFNAAQNTVGVMISNAADGTPVSVAQIGLSQLATAPPSGSGAMGYQAGNFFNNTSAGVWILYVDDPTVPAGTYYLWAKMPDGVDRLASGVMQK